MLYLYLYIPTVLLVNPRNTTFWITFKILRHQRNALSKETCHSWIRFNKRTKNQKNDINVMRFTINGTLPLWVRKRPIRKNSRCFDARKWYKVLTFKSKFHKFRQIMQIVLFLSVLWLANLLTAAFCQLRCPVRRPS